MMVKAIQLQICGLVSQRWTWKPRTVSSFSSFSPIPYPNPNFKLLPSNTIPRRLRFVPFHASSSPPLPSAGNVRNIKFCQWCGGSTKHDIPEGEEKLRAICTVCGKIAYQNPKMDSSCWLFGNRRVCCGRCHQGNEGGSKCRCRSNFSICPIGHSFNWPNLYDILSKAEEAPFFTWSRIIGMPTFST